MNVLLPLALRRAGARELKEFQAAQGLPETGVLDEATQANSEASELRRELFKAQNRKQG